MANIVITSTEKNIDTDFGIYSTALRFKKSLKAKSTVNSIGLKDGDEYVEMSLDGVTLALVWTTTAHCYVVDSVDGIAPTSNSDLYNKLTALVKSQKITQMDEASDTITYIGKANPGSLTSAAVWSIQRIDDSTPGETIILFADGNPSEDNIWDNRASLSYS